MERIGAQVVTLVVSFVLARILPTDEYGVLSIVMVVITILQVFIDSGLANALIQKKDADDVDFSTVFYFNIIACVLLYLLLFLITPFIEEFYKIPNLSPLLRVLGLTLIISGLKNVQQAYVSRNMLFKRFFFATIGGTLISGIVGIVLACLGYGAWALVYQHLLNALIDTIILWVTVKWRPKLAFSFKKLKSLFIYGSSLLASQLLTVVYNNVRQLIIGKKYTVSNLAFYSQGEKISGLIVNNINTSIDSVLFPSMSSVQDVTSSVKNMTKRAIKVSSYVIMPIMMFLAICAEPLVNLVLTEKWLPCVPYLRIFCIIYVFYPIHTANLNAIKAVGRSEIYLKLETIKDVIGLISIMISVPFGVLAIAIAYLISTLIATYINAYPNKKLLDYTYLEQLKDIAPQFFLSLFMGFVIYFFNFLPIANIFIIAIQGIVGLAIYFGFSILFKIDTFYYILNMIKLLFLKFKRRKEAND